MTILTNEEKATIVNSKIKNLEYNKFSNEIDKISESAKSIPDTESVARYNALIAENVTQISALTAELSKYTTEEE
jgi:hypothetical protein